MSEIPVPHCLGCPMCRWEDGSSRCAADPQRRAINADSYSKRLQPSPPDWCPAREGITIRFEKPSSLGKIVRGYVPPKIRDAALGREQYDPDPGWDADDDPWIGMFDRDIPF